jgi:predicted nucleic-acid-binding protein
MTGLDTNVLVRYIVQDDPRQSAKAADFIESAARKDEDLFVGPIVLCELIWVLDGAYGFSRTEIGDVVQQMLETDHLEIEPRDLAWQALADYRSTNVDFADSLLGRMNQSAGCKTTVTFDRARKALSSFRTL